MLKRALEQEGGKTLDTLGQQALVERNARQVRAVGTLMSVVDTARTNALQLIDTTGVGDVALPTEEETAALETSGIRQSFVLQTEPPSSVLEPMAQGFVEAAWIVGHRLQTDIAGDNMAAVPQHLTQLRMVGQAWAAVENAFQTPEAENALKAFDGTRTRRGQEPQEATDPAVALMMDAMQAARMKFQEKEPAEAATQPAQEANTPDAAQRLKAFWIAHEKETVGEYLRWLRLRDNRTQSDVATAAGDYLEDKPNGFSVSYISAVERGEIHSSQEAIGVLANVFELHIDPLDPVAVTLALKVLQQNL